MIVDAHEILFHLLLLCSIENMSDLDSDYMPNFDAKVDDKDDSFESSDDESEDFSYDIIFAGLWTFISNLFSDLHLNTLPILKKVFHLLYPVFANGLSLGQCFETFMSPKVVFYLYDCLNKHANLQFQDKRKNMWVVMEISGLARAFFSACFLDGSNALARNPHCSLWRIF